MNLRRLIVTCRWAAVIGPSRWLCTALLVAALGCGSSGPPAGSERGACYPNGTCNAGLECRSNVCVQTTTAGTAGAGGTTSTGAAGTGSAGAAGTGSDAGAGTGASSAGTSGQTGDGAAGAGADAAADAGTDGGTKPDVAVGPAGCGFVMPNSVISGLPNPAMYDVTTTGVAVDKVTGLMWERSAVTGNNLRTQATARCEDLELGGFSDWRLPTILELTSIVALGGAAGPPPATEGAVFEAPSPIPYWTATLHTNQQLTWWINLSTGVSGFMIPLPTQVRCVRATATPAPRCWEAGHRYQVAAGMVTDAATGLTWQQATGPQAVTWAEAKIYCSGQAGGLRLPSSNELQTLVDYATPSPGPMIDVAAFPDTLAAGYWTASFPRLGAAPAMTVSFKDGNNVPSAAVNRVRCVR